MNRTTEISADWSSVNDIYQAARRRIIDEIPDITMMGGHSSHSYVNGTNMYFNYFFNVVSVGPAEETDKYYLPIIRIIVEETLRRGGSIVHHHGIGKARAPWIKDEHGSSYYMLETLKKAFDPERRHEQGNDLPDLRMGAMRIAVGFKVTPDYEALRTAGWAQLAAAPSAAERAAAGRYVRRARRVRRGRAGARAAPERRARGTRARDRPLGLHRRRPRRCPSWPPYRRLGSTPRG